MDTLGNLLYTIDDIISISRVLGIKKSFEISRNYVTLIKRACENECLIFQLGENLETIFSLNINCM